VSAVSAVRAIVIGGVLGLAVALGPRAAVAGPTPCAATPGYQVVLESDAVDPEVFLWDSKTRLVDYAAGLWNSTQAIFRHTVLAEPGTHAVVITCIPAMAHPRFSTGIEDVVGVRVTTGPYRGRYGWVLSSDAHVPRPTGQSAVLPGSPSQR
jgi:hypothetical protein